MMRPFQKDLKQLRQGFQDPSQLENLMWLLELPLTKSSTKDLPGNMKTKKMINIEQMKKTHKKIIMISNIMMNKQRRRMNTFKNTRILERFQLSKIQEF